MPRSHPLYRQLARVWRLSGRWLPNGWLDAIRQLALFAGAYYLYRLVRGFVDGQAGLAFENARNLVHLERSVGLFFEPGLQAWARGQDWILTWANWMYVNSHFVITTTFLIWLYIARNHAFYYVRNMFMVAMTLALAGYLVYPTAPPRFLPEWGFTDTVAQFVGDGASNSASVLYNPFAAVPSMHVAFALMIAVPGVHARPQPAAQGLLGDLPGAHHLRRDGHRQPLLDGRRARRRGRRGVRVGRVLRLRPRPPGGMGVPHGEGLGVSDGLDQRTRRERGNGRSGPLTAAEMRAVARNRLIESRLTPNAISLTGLVGNLIAAGADPQPQLRARGRRLHPRLALRHVRRALLAHVGQGHAVRRVPRLHARPHRGGRRAGRRRRWFAEQGDEVAVGATVLAVVGSYMVSYTRARAEALGVSARSGLPRVPSG